MKCKGVGHSDASSKLGTLLCSSPCVNIAETQGILAGLGCGLNWAVTSLVVRTLLGRLTPAGIGALRATGGGGILVGVALAAGEGPAIFQAPVWVVLSLATAIRIPVAAVVLWLTPWTRGTPAAVRASTPSERWRLVALCLLNAVGSILFTVAIRSGGVAIGNALASTSPLFAIPLEVLVLRRRPPLRTVAGAVLTVIGIACLGF